MGAYPQEIPRAAVAFVLINMRNIYFIGFTVEQLCLDFFLLFFFVWVRIRAKVFSVLCLIWRQHLERVVDRRFCTIQKFSMAFN